MTVEFFISGIAFITFFLAGLFFLKFWRASGDRLFKLLWFFFWLMATERVLGLISYMNDPSEAAQDSLRIWLYTLRIIAFLIILVSMIDKNRSIERR